MEPGSFTITLDPPLGAGEKHLAEQVSACSKIEAGKATLTVSTKLKTPPESPQELVPLVQKLMQGQVVVDLTAGRIDSVQLGVDRTVENHQGRRSSYRFRTRTYAETWLAGRAAELFDARRGKATKGPTNASEQNVVRRALRPCSRVGLEFPRKIRRLLTNTVEEPPPRRPFVFVEVRLRSGIVGTVLVADVLSIGENQLVSYAGTLWSQSAPWPRTKSPTASRSSGARHEIAQLDKDITAMIRLPAEHKAEVARLDKEIAQLQTNLDGRREKLLKATSVLETVSTVRDGSRVQLDRDFDGFKRLEKQEAALRKMRDAKQSAFDGAQAQLAKMVSTKRDFEVRLTQLEADEETIRVAAIGSKIAVDDNRASAIEAALREIERRHEVSRAELELANGDLVEPATAAPGPSVSEMRAYLERK